MDSIEHLPLKERVARISTASITAMEWRQSWDECVSADVNSMTAVEVQAVIDECERNAYRWTATLHDMYDRRHQLRVEAMEALRSELASLAPESRLLTLIRTPSIPVENYPVELSNDLTREFLIALSDDERSRALARIRATRLRAWKRALARVGELNL